MKHLGRSLLAAVSMFTRLPVWRMTRLDKEDYEHVIDWWAVVGLLTGSVLLCVVLLLGPILPLSVVILIALASRMIFTGAFHEDGLGDFFDGFGGGRCRDKVLAIMKDSHIGSYAVLGYLLYYLLLWQIYASMGSYVMVAKSMLICDIVGKWVSSWQVQCLPYARAHEDSKTGVVYRRARIVPIFLGVTLVLLLPLLFDFYSYVLGALALSCLVGAILMLYIKRRIGGYTGDTCGAIALLVELSMAFFLLCVVSLISLT